LTKPRRGEVWRLDYDPPLPKSRPWLVISADSINLNGRRVLAIPTSSDFELAEEDCIHVDPTAENGLPETCYFVFDALSAIPYKSGKWQQRVGKVDQETLERVEHRLYLVLGLSPPTSANKKVTL
jgi:mRNA-degrading endonuclease toxin of MazEF toxin-antitoxin module